MIKVRIAVEADQLAWDQFVTRHPLGSPYHMTAWNEAIRCAYQQRVYCLLAEDSQGQIQGLLPLTLIGLPFINRQLCSQPYCDLGGILANDKETYNSLLSYAEQIARKHGNLPLELRHSSAPNCDLDLPIEPPNGQKVRMLLKLPGSAVELLSSFKSKLRSQVKKAEKNGISFRIAHAKEDRAGFYHVMQVNMRELGSPVHSHLWYDEVLDRFDKNAILGIAEYEGKVVGGAILLLCGDTATVPWASTLPEYNKLAPNMALYWGILSHAADHGCHYFDFGRSTVGEGTYRFKQQWGAKPIMLDWQNWKSGRQQDTKAIQESATGNSRIREWIVTIWRSLPHSITDMMGPLIRRHISL